MPETTKLEEINLIDFSKRTLASDTTVGFSKERRGLMGSQTTKDGKIIRRNGEAPNTTKFVDLSIDTRSDSVTFYFLTEATKKYEPEHEYKDVNPNANFQLERDPSELYEIQLKFFKVSELISTRPMTLDTVKNWLWSTDFAIWSNSPSFHWQGFNYNLSQLGAAIFPTNIAPKKWDKIHGDALVDKHLYDLFIHIKFFINTIAGSFMNKIKVSTKAKPTTKLQVPPSAPIEVAPVTPKTTELPVEKETDIDSGKQTEIAPEENLELNASEEKPEEPKEIEKGVDAQVTKTEEKTYKWKQEDTSLIVETSKVKGVFSHPTLLIAEKLLEYNTKNDTFYKRFSENVEWRNRTALHEDKPKEVNFTAYFTELDHESSVGLIQGLKEYMDNEKGNTDILSFGTGEDSTLSEEFYSTVASFMEKSYPEYRKEIMYDNRTLKSQMFLVKESVWRNYKEDITSEKFVIGYGDFAPPTQDHLSMINTIMTVAGKEDAYPLVFIKKDPSYTNDDILNTQIASVIKEISPEINICTNEDIASWYDAFQFCYREGCKELIVICGSDELQEVKALLDAENGKTTPEGEFKFLTFKVASYGKPDPDKGRITSLAHQAILDNDFNAFMKSTKFPHSSPIDLNSIQRMFKMLRGKATNKAGLN